MATIEQENEQRQKLTAVLDELSNIKPQDLVREESLGRELNFKGGLPFFERTLKLFRDLKDSNIDTIPHGNLVNLFNCANQALQYFKQIQGFSLQQHPQNPTNVRDQLINQIRDSYDNYFSVISPVVAYSVRKGTDFDRLEREARETLENLRKIVSDQEKERLAMMGEIQGVLEKVKRAAQEVGVAQHAVHFKEEATEHDKAAGKWLVATGILALVTVIFGAISLYYYFTSVESLTTTQNIQLVVAKLIVFSVLFSAVLWTGRIYRAHRHNYVINKHRQNALSTFETFVKASNDDQTKSAVLLQTTQCIFAPQHSGYVSQETETTTSPQILEIIRNISGTHAKPGT